jgi:L-alanine-DL-glutamate epimerase-like enolase superfamily enzyme
LPLDPIVSVEVYPTRLPTRAILHLSRGPVSDEFGAPHVFVRVRDASGAEGWGEARPSHRWSDETEETVVSTIRTYLAPAIIGRDPTDLAGLHAAMDRVIAPGLTRGQPIAKSAIDLAVHDLLGRRLDLGLPALFGRANPGTVPLCWMVSADNPAEAEEQVRQGYSAGYRGFKVKIGVRPEYDIAIVETVRAVDPTAYLWVDANQAYDVGTALKRARTLARIGVSVFEQPTPARDLDALRRLRSDGSVPIAVDESVFSMQDLLRLFWLDAFDVIVVKVSKLGGLWHTRRFLDVVEETGVQVLGSGLTESGLATGASAALLGTYRLAGPADFNGPQMLQAAPGVPSWRVENGALVVPPGPGIGVQPDLQWLHVGTVTARTAADG